MSVTHHDARTAIEKLSDTGLALADGTQDIRGRMVTDPKGNDIGRISSLFIDTELRHVRMVEIHSGGFLGMGERHVLLPVDAITSVGTDRIMIDQTRDRVASAPAYDPAIVEARDREDWMPLYGYYGKSPYWSDGYVYPRYNDLGP